MKKVNLSKYYVRKLLTVPRLHPVSPHFPCLRLAFGANLVPVLGTYFTPWDSDCASPWTLEVFGLGRASVPKANLRRRAFSCLYR